MKNVMTVIEPQKKDEASFGEPDPEAEPARSMVDEMARVASVEHIYVSHLPCTLQLTDEARFSPDADQSRARTQFA